MIRLYIELYMDEDVDVLVADLARARGFHATTTQQAGWVRTEDAEQLGYAISLGAAMFTHNRAGFEALAAEYFREGRTHFGIIIAVQRPRANSPDASLRFWIRRRPTRWRISCATYDTPAR